MIVKVKYFGRFAVQLNKFGEEISVPDGITVSEFITLLKKKYPELEKEELEISINGKYVRPSDKIKDRDVAIYPPISGG